MVSANASLLSLALLLSFVNAGHLRSSKHHLNAARAAREVAFESKRQWPTFALSDKYQGSNFFDEWDFFTGSDPTHGSVNYLSSSDAWNAGLVSTTSTTSTIKVDDTTWLANGVPRNSVRIQTQKQYSGGLFVLDINAMPYGPSVWPAWWTVGQDWPSGGEIDIVEAVNNGTNNQMTLHTDAGCTLSTNVEITGHILSTTCDANVDFNAGCAILDPDATSSGKGLSDAGGAVFAMLWDGSGVRIWHFARADVPQDIYAGNPTPAGWGSPKAQWSAGTCNPDVYLKAHNVVFDTTLCGDWAGSVYADAGYPNTCAEQVMDPTNFQTASWQINYVAVYHETS